MADLCPDLCSCSLCFVLAKISPKQRGERQKGFLSSKPGICANTEHKTLVMLSLKSMEIHPQLGFAFLNHIHHDEYPWTALWVSLTWVSPLTQNTWFREGITLAKRKINIFCLVILLPHHIYTHCAFNFISCLTDVPLSPSYCPPKPT